MLFHGNFLRFIFIYVYVCATLYMGTYGSQKAELEYSRATDGCEPPDMGTGNQTQVLWKNSEHSWLMNHLSGPHMPIV